MCNKVFTKKDLTVRIVREKVKSGDVDAAPGAKALGAFLMPWERSPCCCIAENLKGMIILDRAADWRVNAETIRKKREEASAGAGDARRQ